MAKLREEYPPNEYGYELRALADGKSSIEVVLSEA
jgi:hypothetical protein